MTKEKKWKYKFLSEEKFSQYQKMSQEKLIKTIKEQAAYQEQCKKSKTGSDYLKELRGDIADFRKNWLKNNPEEWEQVNNALQELKEKRDSGIQDAIDEKKDIEGGLNDAVKGANEHIEALLFCLRFHQ